MEKFKTMVDFAGEGIIPVLSALVTAIPAFFSIMLFTIWIFGTASSFFIILSSTGKKRFFHSLTAMGFACFIFSLIIAGMNTPLITYLEGYWVGFYILMTAGSWLLLEKYK